MFEFIYTIIDAAGGQIACLLIVMCIANIILNLYSRRRNSRAAALWFKSTQNEWFKNYKRLQLKKHASEISMVPDGPMISTLFATGRKNLKYVCVEFEAPKNSDLTLLLSQFFLSRPLEYTLTLQACITRKDNHGPILLGLFPNDTALSLIQSNWALSKIAKPSKVRGISDDHYTIVAESKNFLDTIASDENILIFLNNSRGKNSQGVNLSINEASLCPKIKYLVISDSFHEPPVNKRLLFASDITVTLKTSIPSPHLKSSKIHEAYASTLKFFFSIVDYVHTNSSVPQSTLTTLLASRQAVHDDPSGATKQKIAEEIEERRIKMNKDKGKLIDSLSDSEKHSYLEERKLKDSRRRANKAAQRK